MEAERMTGWVRVVLALALAVSLLGSGGIASVAGYDEFWARLGLGALAVAAFLALGVASFSRIGSYAPWMAFAFTAADAAIIVLAVGATLRDTGLGGNWIAIAPALWAAPLILAVGALRYRPVQLWVTGLMVVGLGLVVAVSGASIFVSPPDATAFANASAYDLLSFPPTWSGRPCWPSRA